MRYRRILILLLVMSLWGGTMLFADAAADEVRVIVNGSDPDGGGMIIDGKTYLPLRQIATALDAFVSWDNDTKQVIVNKPNVHMFLFQDKLIFGNVSEGNSYTFNVFAQIDNLHTNISAVKVAIADPGGTETTIQSENVSIAKDNFWYRTKDFNYSFDQAGKYAVHFYMKPAGQDNWQLVSEKQITAQ